MSTTTAVVANHNVNLVDVDLAEYTEYRVPALRMATGANIGVK